MQNGQSKAKMNGHGGPAKPAPAGKQKAAPSAPAPGPFTFVDELPGKIRSLVQGAVEAVQNDAKKNNDQRYLDGMRRGAFLIGLAVSTLDGEAKTRVAGALEQLENELNEETKKLRQAHK